MGGWANDKDRFQEAKASPSAPKHDVDLLLLAYKVNTRRP